jgi:hypothetical protein
MNVFSKQAGKPPTWPQPGAPVEVAHSGAGLVGIKSTAMPLADAWLIRLSNGAQLLAGYELGSAALKAGRLRELGLGAIAFQAT